MAIKVAIQHKTVYHYDKLIKLSPHVFRLRPAVHCRTPIEGYSLNIEPENHFINWQQDPFGNYQARVVFPDKSKKLSVEVEVIADMTVINPFDFFVEEYAEHFPFNYDEQLKKELTPYLEIKEEGPLLKEWLNNFKVDSKLPIVDFLVGLNQKVYKDISYTIRMEPGVQTCEDTLGKELGSCRDSGWLLVQILRHLGLAARFVSGYLVQLKADQEAIGGPSGPVEDFTDLHAWAEVYIPGAGWIGLDATSGLFAGEGHIPLACTPDPLSAAPVTGFTEPAKVEFEFENKVTRIHEDPRVTKPYNDHDWEAINALGKKVDEDLKKHDVRMTMGGEPTFVSVEDMEGEEWNTAADGKYKRELAGVLVRKLRDEFGKGAMLHFGQGKWYPGEPLPRWALSCIWRDDEKPIWNDIQWFGEDEKDYGYKESDAKKFIDKLTDYLGISADYARPAYEDIFKKMIEEQTLPSNVDPLEYDLDDPLERKALTEVLDNGIKTPKGYILPIEYDEEENSWSSDYWKLRRKHVFLLQGTSPVGLRLPLDSLEEVDPEDMEPQYETDPFSDLPGLKDYHEKALKRNKKEKVSKKTESKEEPLRTTLCVEPRDGKLFVFMPPLEKLESYLDLVASIEKTATELKLKVIIEGYEPPRDPRIKKLSVTPDPGVIEVNVHPSKNWEELKRVISRLYQLARESKLGAEKFNLDGKHTGTGGGNHITIGSSKPKDSPFLRRPDLLRSMVTYWQHHPSLSYLFSTQFIGPTSQAPRMDEGRDEMLYEMEIAFNQIPEDEEVPFWLVDRIFRNLLVDITGNTHRAEICIDKLYSPDSSTGRLGIVELRGFDMPPHEHLSIVQMLLIRSLISMFWQKPYKHKLIRWGTELHDKFLLPHFVRKDMEDICNDLQSAGYPFQLSWLEPFFEFRFPLFGKAMIKDMELEVKGAIEPWHVLGEEMSSGGTARYVDSSVEKIEVKLKNFTEGRYVLACNGNKVNLRSSGTKGEYIAGIRYRAWSPWSALHPTIGVDVPLKLDIIDTWNGRSIGGCTYHVSHPGGRNYDTFPVNANEAEARRTSRFWKYGHTPGDLEAPPEYDGISHFFSQNIAPKAMEPPIVQESVDYPFTTDLRRTKKFTAVKKEKDK